ncbi:hypothetical protein C9426_08750 [Serratia sp. S1B]|nr:hypothetical protein C9426_08750 [Serratia sp. S1B]
MHTVLDKNYTDVEALATQIIKTCGVCRVLVIGSEVNMLLRALWFAGLDAKEYDLENSLSDSGFCLPFADESFDAIVSFEGVDQFTSVTLPKILAEFRRITRNSLMLCIDTFNVEDTFLISRSGWEVSCFDAGFRKHPLYYLSNDYAALEHDSNRIFIPLEKVPEAAWVRYPMAVLREERDLHMDMLRESGSRSDAHVGRYHFATQFIRPGDVVLDAACGLGYGTYVVRSETRARNIIGIDGSGYGIDYANFNFGGDRIVFRQGILPDCLASIPDNSVDHVLSFETLEHVEDPVAVLAEFWRILTPGGRLTCSVPHDWSDETGEDPNPFHLHVYDTSRFIDELSRYFDIERLIGQTADRVKQPGEKCIWLKRPRSLEDIAVDQKDVEAEWLLAVVAKSPLEGAKVPYQEYVFSPEEQREGGNTLAFSRDYDNPWLIRALISIGLRTENAVLRERWASAVWNDRTTRITDRGAALCVLAYAELARGCATPEVTLLDEIDDYLVELTNDSVITALRWRISLMYVGGLLALSHGRRNDACRLLRGVLSAPAEEYSPTLLTKTAEAGYLLGLLLVGEKRHDEAREIWWQTFQHVSTALGRQLTKGYEACPPNFEMRELATILALCSRLIAANKHSIDQAQSPSIFYDECHADSVPQLYSNKLLFELESGKNWLEQQWRSMQDQLKQKDIELQDILIGKNWLEQQWEKHVAENARLSLELESTRVKEAKLRGNILFRIARFFGFFRYF